MLTIYIKYTNGVSREITTGIETWSDGKTTHIRYYLRNSEKSTVLDIKHDELELLLVRTK